MVYQDGSPKEYAPGVSDEGDGFYGAYYSGNAAALIECGLIKPEWLPGQPGNGKTAQTVLFLEDGTAKLLPARSCFKSLDAGFGGVRIKKSGGINHVLRYWTKEERAKKAAEEQTSKERETWLAAKEAANRPDYPGLWRDGVLLYLSQAERLIEGNMGFNEFPDIGIAESDIKAAKRAIAELRNILAWATPRIKDKVNVSSNVFRLNEAAFRTMRKG